MDELFSLSISEGAICNILARAATMHLLTSRLGHAIFFSITHGASPDGFASVQTADDRPRMGSSFRMTMRARRICSVAGGQPAK